MNQQPILKEVIPYFLQYCGDDIHISLTGEPNKFQIHYEDRFNPLSGSGWICNRPTLYGMLVEWTDKDDLITVYLATHYKYTKGD